MKENKIYWKGLEELKNDPEFLKSRDNEFPEELPTSDNNSNEATRRDFLKVMGFSAAAVTLAACETPVRKAIPYVKKPDTIDPTIPNYYATSFAESGKYCSIVVKTREGRPIKVEGNTMSSISQGGADAQVHASVLGLYDNSRLTKFKLNGTEVDSKENIDAEIRAGLEKVSAEGKSIRIVSETVYSPTAKKAIQAFLDTYPTAEHVMYDPASASGILKANGGIIPDYRFDNADVIVGFNADFLSTWLSSIEYSKGYVKNRKVSEDKEDMKMSRHYQFESLMSVTGSNADYRQTLKPSEEGQYVVALYNAVANKMGTSGLGSVKVTKMDMINKAAADLVAANGRSLVVSGSNDVHVQNVVKALNEMLGNNGSTVLTESPLLIKQGDDSKMLSFVQELDRGDVGAVIFYKSNPVYNYPKGAVIANKLEGVEMSVAISDREDETASLCNYICPTFHYLESWGDVEPKRGVYSLIQPTITPIFKGTRQAEENFLIWSGDNTSYYDYLVSNWKQNLFAVSGAPMFEIWWNSTVQNGVLESNVSMSDSSNIEAQYIGLDESVSQIKKSNTTGSKELVTYFSTSLGDGSMANNPWLQELPDPMTKVTWDNYLSVSVPDAKAMDLKDGDLVKVLVKERGVVKLPVIVQPGQAVGVYAVALGYGRTKAGRMASLAEEKDRKDFEFWHSNPEGKDIVGVDMYPFVNVMADGTINYSYSGNDNLTISADGKTYALGRTQTSQTLAGRDIVRETNLNAFAANPSHLRKYDIHIHTTKGSQDPDEVDIWAAPASTSKEQYQENKKNGIDEEVVTHKYPNHHWGMVIDMNSCTGCSACMISCQVENNIPVVGKDEVVRKRDMEWIRIDRYYSSQGEDSFKALEAATENPDNVEVVFQPMMCQHCNHAPCETVCPVAATTHSTEGLNQMTYNRCIGTRYCANNCPYKVRRFNWFNYSDSASSRDFKAVNYPMNTDLGKMVLNPDVTVRARGVMEKCSLCVQRIQAGKLEAKIEGRRPVDGEIQTACSTSCPADAITFGDMNDPESKISKVIEKENKERSYHVLEELNVKPNISYLAKVRNK